MARRTEVVLAGLAGQGLVFAGSVLADATGLYENKFVSQLGFYSVNARTGPSRSEVIIGDEEIDFPAATEPDVVVAFTKEDAQSYASKMRSNGILIVDPSQENVALPESLSVFMVPFASIARKEFGEELLGNLVALGALASLSDVVSQDSLEQTIRSLFKGQTEERSLKALRLGYSAGLTARKN